MQVNSSEQRVAEISATAFSPGPVDTPLTPTLHMPKFREEYSRAFLVNRYGTFEIASAVDYLVPEDASYVTGISMPVDRGFPAFRPAASDVN